MHREHEFQNSIYTNRFRKDTGSYVFLPNLQVSLRVCQYSFGSSSEKSVKKKSAIFLLRYGPSDKRPAEAVATVEAMDGARVEEDGVSQGFSGGFRDYGYGIGDLGDKPADEE
jgi:hypothetical protein